MHTGQSFPRRIGNLMSLTLFVIQICQQLAVFGEQSQLPLVTRTKLPTTLKYFHVLFIFRKKNHRRQTSVIKGVGNSKFILLKYSLFFTTTKQCDFIDRCVNFVLFDKTHETRYNNVFSSFNEFVNHSNNK